MRRMILVVVCMAAIAVPDGLARSGLAAWVGTVGRPPNMQPSPWDAAHRPSARLVVSGSTAVARFEGYTGATHDAPDLRTNCSMRFRLVKKEEAASYYRQVGLSLYGYPERGYVANAPCEMSRGGSLKTTLSASKLRADFGLAGDPATYWRAYLRHA
jgi:hypothetical protein